MKTLLLRALITCFTATNVPALRFITFAYQVRDFLIEKAPDWLHTDRWDIDSVRDMSRCS